MIAANFRKYPEAIALQMPLPFGHALVWALKRPGSRILRAIRAERAVLIKQHARLEYPAPNVTPQWWKDAIARARAMAKAVRDACASLEIGAWSE